MLEGELAISRVISDDDVANADTDIALYQGRLSDYSINLNGPDGTVEVIDLRALPLNQRPDRAGNEGRDLLWNIERLQFSDQSLVLGGGNSPAVGQPTILGTAESFETLTASTAGVTDLDNVSPGNPTGAITSPIDFTWEIELQPGTGFFTPIVRAAGLNGNGDTFEVHGETLELTPNEEGMLIRLSAMFQDDDLVFELVSSAPVRVAAGTAPGVCGDGVIDAGEECDDGNVIDGDGCSSICMNEVAPPACGDGTLDAGEECDDGNVVDGDGCSAACTVEAPAGTVDITRARYIADQDRLRVRGFVSPIRSSANLFAPGTANAAGTDCTGTFVTVMVTGIDGGFIFNSGRGAFAVDPGEVCVSSDNGAATSLVTSP